MKRAQRTCAAGVRTDASPKQLESHNAETCDAIKETQAAATAAAAAAATETKQAQLQHGSEYRTGLMAFNMLLKIQAQGTPTVKTWIGFIHVTTP